METPSVKSAAVTAAKGLSALGYVLFGSLLCVSCTGLPLLSGIFGGVAIGTRFGVSAGLVTAVVISFTLIRRRRARAQAACALGRPSRTPG